MLLTTTKIKGICFNGHNIIKAYYNENLVFSVEHSELNTDSVFAAGVWEDDNLWNNEDLFSNLI